VFLFYIVLRCPILTSFHALNKIKDLRIKFSSNHPFSVQFHTNIKNMGINKITTFLYSLSQLAVYNTYIRRNSQTAKHYLFYCRLKVKKLKTTSFSVVTPSSGSNHPTTHRNFTLTSIADKN
jgi:hypothetical protein